eukprot:CAMPEP_0113725522 /NCGR_PEP_ID=MMETSP0038_2-20120614/39802_1 /TAXON_ID=2898 /ORGANISM="Cryptomonas paramecium" /LENGTH=338 /DNA_ID=CAMNT_0000655785 /DNA_START=47 /DNA_END=1063 /DNA_ORIENTATION=- /assembly_acc=CAM_ASM_000170
MPKVLVYSLEKYDEKYLVPGLHASIGADNVRTVRVPLSKDTTDLAKGYDAVCLFVNDVCNAEVLKLLAESGVKLILLRNAGFNNVDVNAAATLGLSVRRVPAYSPNAVAEFAVGLLLTTVRKINKAYNRVREHNFSISGLEGFDIHGKVIGIVGTGNIGKITAKILNGFGPSRLIGYDEYPAEDMKAMGMEYVTREELFREADIISMHVPLLPSTYHIINKAAIALMKPGVVIINTSRGALVETAAAVEGLDQRIIGGLAMDVYENESSYFFKDCSDQIMDDVAFSRLLTYPNVIITGHQAFLTREALQTIATTTVQNIKDFTDGVDTPNIVKPQGHI